MRVTMGIVGVLGLGVTVAMAQQPAVPTRTATLLPPQAVGAGEGPPVARASAESLPAFTDSTPVTRPPAKAAGGPAWINGTDSGVRPASGTVSNKSAVRPLTPPREEPSLVAKGYEKLKSSLGGERPPPPVGLPGAAADAANAMAPFRGTTAGGAPVFAGPPAYRWYGWGSVTPGANAYAPTGQYPRASANWYAITGATPGAFPVPVMNPLRPTPGTEPPNYVTTPAPRTPPPVLPAQAANPVPTPTTPPFVPPPADLSKSVTITETPVPPPSAELPPPTIPPPAPVTVPTLTPVPIPVAPPTIAVPPAPITPAAVPTPVPAEPKTIAPAVAPETAPPAPLPVSVTDDQPSWQPTSEKPATGQWTPTTKAAGGPQSSTVGSRPETVARGQMDDRRPDPTAALIRKLCEGRATGIDVRWTGSKKLTVCFECASAPAAQQLVKDICARPELGPLQIDFCVLVK